MNAMPMSAQAACAARLDRVVRGFGMGGRRAELAEVFRLLTRSWGTATAAELAESDVSSDGSPMELALAFEDSGPVVQFAVEPLEPSDSPERRVVVARRVMGELERRYAVSGRRWSQVAELFLPDKPANPHVVMYGAELQRGQPLQFKVWFYPAVQGRDWAVEACDDGLRRLGLGATWPAVLAHMRRDARLDRPVLLSLDLSADTGARVKLYFRHYQADVTYLAALLDRYPGYSRTSVLDFCSVLTADAPSLAERPPVTCLSFTAQDPTRAVSATFYVPMWTGVADDEMVCRRVNRVLVQSGRSADQYNRALRDMAGRPLASGRGIHNYVAWRPGRGRDRIKVYLSPELRHTNPVMRYRLDAQN